jgi:hypothetical protein
VRQIAELAASDGIPSGGYGTAVAVQNNTLLVGADLHHPAVEGCAGAEAYVYRLNPQNRTAVHGDAAEDNLGGGRCGQHVRRNTFLANSPYAIETYVIKMVPGGGVEPPRGVNLGGF